MLSRHTIGDALWQCLCPRYPIALAQAANPARRNHAARNLKINIRSSQAEYRQCRYASRGSLRPRESRVQTGAAEQRGRVLRKSNIENALELQAVQAQHVSTDELYNRLAAHAGKGHVQSVEQLTEYLICQRHEAPNLRLYSALISANISPEEGSALRVKTLLKDLVASGLTIDAGICHEVIKVLSVHLDYMLRNDILEYMRQRWYTITPTGYHYVVAGLLREGQLNLAREWLRHMSDTGIQVQGWLQEVAVYTFLECGEIDEALAQVRWAWERGEQEISESVWSRLLDFGSAAYHHAATSYVWSRRVNLGKLNPSAGTCLNALVAAADVGDVRLATDIFGLLGKRSMVFKAAHYEQLQRTYLNARPPDLLAALNVLMLMAASGLKAEPVDTRPLYEHLRKCPSDIGKSLEIFHHMKDKGQTVPIAGVNVAIESLVQAGRWNEAIEVYRMLHTFQTNPKRPFANIETFHQLLLGARSVEPVAYEEAEFLASEVERLDLKPDQLLYDRMVLVCLKAERLDAAWRSCDAMVARGWRPRPGTAKELVRLSIAQGGEDAYDRCVRLGDVCPELPQSLGRLCNARRPPDAQEEA